MKYLLDIDDVDQRVVSVYPVEVAPESEAANVKDGHCCDQYGDPLYRVVRV